MAGNSEEHALSGCISDLYFLGDQEEGEEEKGVLLKSKAYHLPRTIKRSYGMNTTLIQS